MSNEIDYELLSCFLEEADDLLREWERCCLDLEVESALEGFDRLFRVAHNLKGSSRVVGLENLGQFVHRIEDLISQLVKGDVSYSPKIAEFLLDAQVSLQKWIAELKGASDYNHDTAALLQQLVQLSPLIKAPDGTADSAERPFSENLNSSTELTDQEVEEIFRATKAQDHKTQTQPAATDLTIESAIADLPTPHSPKSKQEGSQSDQRKAKSEETIRVSAAKLDELIQLIGELSIHQAIINQGKRDEKLGNKVCQNSIHLSAKITKDLHTKALSLRMQPLHSLFQRLERVIRDVASSLGKPVKLVTEGANVELDRSVIERVVDPLVHILRNAIDHGVEDAPSRSAAGKDPLSTVMLSASQDASGVCIRISDDGRGLDPEKILHKATMLGLVSADARLSTEAIYNLIFLPGFSTAQKVTDISGRGVGLDVVMRAVQGLQGSISIESHKGKGTSFTITLPTSLSIIDALVVTLENIKYAVPMHELTEIIDLASHRIESSGAKNRMITIRGELVPLTALANHLVSAKSKPSATQAISCTKPALVIREGKELIAFEIDSIIGQQQVVVRPLTQQLTSVHGFNGCTILGDGEPGMILSLTEIARGYMESSLARQELQ
jgi:two-component system chemotaxis sensor kinase CheA